MNSPTHGKHDIKCPTNKNAFTVDVNRIHLFHYQPTHNASVQLFTVHVCLQVSRWCVKKSGPSCQF